MKVKLLLCVAAGFVSIAASSADQSSISTEQLAEEVASMAVRMHCLDLEPRLRELASRPDFAEVLDNRRQSMFLVQMAQCQADNGNVVTALEFANRAALADPASFGVQGTRMVLGVLAGRPADTIDSMQVLSLMRPYFIRTVTPDFVDQVVRAAREFDGTGELELKFHDILESVQWIPPPPASDDDLRLAHARLLIQRERIDDALRRLAPVTNLKSIVAMRVDREFDPLRKHAAFEAQLSLVDAPGRSIDRSSYIMTGNARSMAAVRSNARALTESMRFEEVEAITSSTLDRYEGDPTSFDDGESNVGWLVNQRSNALYALGRFDEGREVFRHFVDSRQDSSIDGNVLNFASYLLFEGRARESLALLPRISTSVPGRRAWIEALRSCAAAQLGEHKLSEISLEYLRAHQFDSASAFATALLCIDKLDEAANFTIRCLGDRDQRQETLLLLQIRPRTAFGQLPLRKQILDRYQELRQRPDVVAAVESVGRIETIPLMVGESF